MGFDLDAYTRGVAPVAYDDLDYGAFADAPLSADALRSLRYMCDIESHTVCYLRDLRSTRAQRLTRWALRRFWAPVGAGVMPDTEVRHLIRFLMGDTDGAHIDAKIHRLPGQSGLDLVSRAVTRFA